MGDGDRLLFEIPVYRLDEDAFYREQEGLMQPHISAERRHHDEARAQANAARLVNACPWQFNDIVGWVTVHGYRDMIKSYLWWTTAKRLVRHPTRDQFAAGDKIAETGVWPEMTDTAIAAGLKADILRGLAEARRENRHVDFRSFDRLAPNLRWKEMLGVS